MADEITINTRNLSQREAAALHRRVQALSSGPPIVCLCGSTRFKTEYEEQAGVLTLQGFIVLTVGAFGHSGDQLTDVEKALLDTLHLRKIDLSCRVTFICPGGYIGDSTRRELAYARALGKDLTFPYGEPTE